MHAALLQSLQGACQQALTCVHLAVACVIVHTLEDDMPEYNFEQALDVLNDMVGANFGLTNTGMQLKGYVYDFDSNSGVKTYWDPHDLINLIEALQVIHVKMLSFKNQVP